MTIAARRQLAALGALAEDIAQSAEWGLSDPGLGEIESFRMAHSILAERGVLKYAVPARHGGADVAGLAEPDTVSVRALAALRQKFAFHHAMLDLALVEQGLGSFPIASGPRTPSSSTCSDGSRSAR